MNRHYFESDDVNDLYKQLIAAISEDPQYRTAPRGMDIKENIGVVAKLTNPRNCIVSMKERKLNYAFAAVEKLEYLTGQTDPERLGFYNPNFVNYRSEYNYFDGAYPERLAYWYRHIYNLLKTDADTRQAVFTIYGPQDRHKSKDIPCTLSFQFFIRENKLNMIATMRSNDLLWGFPYDTNGFCFIQEALAATLGLELGTYELHAGSLHLYTEREGQLTNLLGTTVALDYTNPLIPPYESLDALQNDLKKFWICEYELRVNNVVPEVWKDMPAWLQEYFSVVQEFVAKKHNKQLPL